MLYSMDIPSTDSLNALYPTGNHWIPGVQFNNGVPAEQAMEIPWVANMFVLYDHGG